MSLNAHSGCARLSPCWRCAALSAREGCSVCTTVYTASHANEPRCDQSQLRLRGGKETPERPSKPCLEIPGPCGETWHPMCGLKAYFPSLVYAPRAVKRGCAPTHGGAQRCAVSLSWRTKHLNRGVSARWTFKHCQVGSPRTCPIYPAGARHAVTSPPLKHESFGTFLQPQSAPVQLFRHTMKFISPRQSQ